jgi:hypothetical protein
VRNALRIRVLQPDCSAYQVLETLLIRCGRVDGRPQKPNVLASSGMLGATKKRTTFARP